MATVLARGCSLLLRHMRAVAARRPWPTASTVAAPVAYTVAGALKGKLTTTPVVPAGGAADDVTPQPVKAATLQPVKAATLQPEAVSAPSVDQLAFLQPPVCLPSP